MSLKIIVQILIILIISYILSIFVQQKLLLNYNYTKMSVKLDMFNGNGLYQLSSKKLSSTLKGYGIVADHFNPKNISQRINAKILNGTMCKRSQNALKRPPRIKNLDNLYLDINIIFTIKKNAKICSDEIEEYITSQKSYFFSEVQSSLDNAKLREDEQKKGRDKGFFKITSSGSVVTMGKNDIKIYMTTNYDLDLANKGFLQLRQANLFRTESQIFVNNDVNSILRLQNLFSLIALLIFLVVYKKIFKEKFNLLKNKIISVIE